MLCHNPLTMIVIRIAALIWIALLALLFIAGLTGAVKEHGMGALLRSFISIDFIIILVFMVPALVVLIFIKERKGERT